MKISGEAKTMMTAQALTPIAVVVIVNPQNDWETATMGLACIDCGLIAEVGPDMPFEYAMDLYAALPHDPANHARKEDDDDPEAA